MTIPEILAELKNFNGVFQREALQEAVAQREAITPELLRILEEDTARLAEIAPDDNYMAHMYAMYLLAQFREPQAYPLLVQFFSSDFELLELAVGDTITEGLNRMLASTCNGDLTLIKQMVENPALNEFIRNAALGALVVLVTEEALSRDKVMSYFRELFNSRLERSPSYIWNGLVGACCDLHPGELMPEIEQAFADDLIDPFHIGMEDVRRYLAKSKETLLKRLPNDNNNRFINDTIEEMEYWPCFKNPQQYMKPSQPQMQPAIPLHAPPPANKAGKNEPCPCGSGKKYKRCCGS